MNDALVDLLCKLERVVAEEATQFAVVTVDPETNVVLHATGPFAEPEAALVQAGLDDRRWKQTTNPDEDGELRYLVVPLWEPDA